MCYLLIRFDMISSIHQNMLCAYSATIWWSVTDRKFASPASLVLIILLGGQESSLSEHYKVARTHET